MYIHHGVVNLQFGYKVNNSGIAQVRTVFLEREAEHQDSRIGHLQLPHHHELDDLTGYIDSHIIVDVV